MRNVISNLFIKYIIVIGCTPQFPSYLSALLPQDQIFDSDSEQEASPVKKKKEKEPEKKSKDGKQEGKKLMIFIAFITY